MSSVSNGLGRDDICLPVTSTMNEIVLLVWAQLLLTSYPAVHVLGTQGHGATVISIVTLKMRLRNIHHRPTKTILKAPFGL